MFEGPHETEASPTSASASASASVGVGAGATTAIKAESKEEGFYDLREDLQQDMVRLMGRERYLERTGYIDAKDPITMRTWRDIIKTSDLDAVLAQTSAPTSSPAPAGNHGPVVPAGGVGISDLKPELYMAGFYQQLINYPHLSQLFSPSGASTMVLSLGRHTAMVGTGAGTGAGAGTSVMAPFQNVTVAPIVFSANALKQKPPRRKHGTVRGRGQEKKYGDMHRTPGVRLPRVTGKRSKDLTLPNLVRPCDDAVILWKDKKAIRAYDPLQDPHKDMRHPDLCLFPGCKRMTKAFSSSSNRNRHYGKQHQQAIQEFYCAPKEAKAEAPTTPIERLVDEKKCKPEREGTSTESKKKKKPRTRTRRSKRAGEPASA